MTLQMGKKNLSSLPRWIKIQEQANLNQQLHSRAFEKSRRSEKIPSGGSGGLRIPELFELEVLMFLIQGQLLFKANSYPVVWQVWMIQWIP